ncbi:MAG TPA: Gfo/Idh/MocA family oxidoreductase [Candidatus Hydrogenedentes bacterium]|nr:Gfo/Idh/MocA family oxidoreductase [Candidatus Hydrogenedentota bacterium]HQE84500.1 Gfo/Idh/MocA family oxidoreductase [Candidatus Hydrogenedentota bacterium]HQM49211.1 Gfo/Idh/MocA family oxidoreductase [Candidatus Hydrogenedentota bacterium]
MTNELDRRAFLKAGSRVGAGMMLAGAAAAQTAGEQPQPQPAGKPVRIGLVGYGKRGRSLISTLNALGSDVEIRAVCDVVPERVAEAQTVLEGQGRPKPAGYSQGDQDFRRLCEQEDLDLVMNAAPWHWHVPICVAAMESGKHTATEVPAAVTVDECWQLVDTAEKTGKHCVLLENCCYFRNAMMVLNMVRRGLLGEMLHAEAGYQHYRIANNVFDAEGNLLWCGEHEARRNGCLYPTHQVGPVGQWMNITRGDQFAYLVSMSSKSRGLNLYAAKHFGPDHPLATREYALGDINITLIRTENGLTVTLYHDTQAPRPYDLIYRAQGTNGLYMGTLDKIFIEGRSQGDQWEDIGPYLEEFEHPLWKALQQNALGHGHGGGDYIMMYRLLKCLREGIEPDSDVYDAVAWSVIAPLSEMSVADKSRPVDFPDFTRGKWRERQPLGIVEA